MESNVFDTSTPLSYDEGEIYSNSAPTMIYLLGSHLTCSPALYSKASITLPMIYEARPIRVGSTSIDVYQALYDEQVLLAQNPSFKIGNVLSREHARQSFLASRIVRCVNFDPDAKQPKAFSDSLREKILSFTTTVTGSTNSDTWIPPAFPIMNLPESIPPGIQASKNYYKCEIVAQYSDLDNYFHVNQGSYPAYALDCAAQAAEAGVLKSFADGDICFHNVHTVSSMYSAESHAGDCLSVTTWECESDPCTLNFLITHDDHLVFRSKLVYYPKGGWHKL